MDYIVAAANLRAYMFGIKGKVLNVAFLVFCYVGISLRNSQSEALPSCMTASVRCCATLLIMILIIPFLSLIASYKQTICFSLTCQ